MYYARVYRVVIKKNRIRIVRLDSFGRVSGLEIITNIELYICE